jgi:DNA-binding XRE family transcriptional regulator
MLKVAQIRAARALANWSQNDLASAAGLSRRTLISIEAGAIPLEGQYLRDLVAAFERVGVEFISLTGGAYGVIRRAGHETGGH